MERKILTTHCELLCLDSEKFWGPFLLGGNALLKSLTALVLAVFIFAAPALAAPGDAAFNQAQDLKSKGDLPGALTAAYSGLAVDPANPKLTLLVGDIYFGQAKYDSALTYYQKTIEKKAKDQDALYGAGMSALRLKSYDQAIQYFGDGQKTGKNKPKFFYGLGLAQMEKGDFQSADINFRQAIDKDKKNPEYHLALGEVNYRSKTYPIALAEFNKAIELDSSLYSAQTDIHYKMAQSQFNLRNVTQAIQEYQIDVQLHPADTTAWIELSHIYDVSGNTAQAVFCYEKYLAISPNNGQAWFDLGKLYLKVPDQEKAAVAFEKAVSLKSKEAESYGYLAKIYADRKEYEKAFDAYNRFEATLGAPDSASYWLEKGKVLMKVGEKNPNYFDTALVAFQKCIQLDSTFSQAYEYAGLTRYYQKNYADAINYFMKEIALDSTSINTYRNLAFSYLKTEQYSGAARAFSKALDLKPDDITMRSMLGRIYSFNKDYENSVKQYEYILSHENPELSDSVRCEIYPELGSSYLQLQNCQASLPVLLKAERCKPNDFSIIMNIAASYEFCNKMKDAHDYYKKALDINPSSKDAKKGLMRNTISGK
jgi:tetratricopeptide (TPR) repeat protein